MIEITDKFSNHKSWYYTGNEIAKTLGLRDNNNKLIGRNKFYQLLRDNDILMDGNVPYQTYIMLDLIIYHQVMKGHHKVSMLLFTEKGMSYLLNRFKPKEYVDEDGVIIIENSINLKNEKE